MTVVIKLEIMTAHKIANPSIQAVALWSTSTIISTTFKYIKILIDTNAATIKILSVKSSRASNKRTNTDFKGLLTFSLDPKKLDRLSKESSFTPVFGLVYINSRILLTPNNDLKKPPNFSISSTSSEKVLVWTAVTISQS